jgi:hypothetical protein
VNRQAAAPSWVVCQTPGSTRRYVDDNRETLPSMEVGNHAGHVSDALVRSDPVLDEVELHLRDGRIREHQLCC